MKQLLPIVAELRLFAEQASMTDAQVGKRLGIPLKEVRSFFEGQVPPPAVLETMADLVRDLRRQLGLSRAPGRPATGHSPTLRGTVPPEIGAWVEEQGGWAFVRGLLEKAYNGR